MSDPKPTGDGQHGRSSPQYMTEMFRRATGSWPDGEAPPIDYELHRKLGCPCRKPRPDPEPNHSE